MSTMRVKNGKKKWYGGCDLKKSQEHPAGLGEAIQRLVQLHMSDIEVPLRGHTVANRDAPTGGRGDVLPTAGKAWGGPPRE
eukprot:12907561-Alexandrium_andersonii.AAC.1